MNYKRVYDQIIENRKNNTIIDGYSEKHHIIPKSLGGSDEKDNIIILTAREHFICHYLLAKMYEKETFEWYKMNNAFLMMKCNSLSRQQRYFNSRLYEALRKDFSSIMSLNQKGKNNSQYGTMWICNLETKENKKIKKDETIPEGWVKGRDKWKTKIKKCKHDSHVKAWRLKITDKEKRKEAEYYWKMFLESNYKTPYEFSKNNYPKSNVYLHKLWKNYIVQYSENSSQGKRFNKDICR